MNDERNFGQGHADHFLAGHTRRTSILCDDVKSCPCCVRGVLKDGKCERCGVVIAKGSVRADEERIGRRPRRRQDQDRVSRLTDYVRTRADQE